MKKNRALYGRLALFATSLIWGTSFVILKNTLNSIGTLWVLAIRFSFAALLLLCFTFRSVRRASPRCIRGGLWMGAALAAAYIFQTYGLTYTTPGKNAFLTSTYCVLTPFFSWALYRRRPELPHFVAAALCIVGIGLVSLNESFSAVNRGDLLTLCCGVFYTVHILQCERFGDCGSTATLSTIQFAAAALICWVGALLFEAPPRELTPGVWASIAYLTVFCTAVCFYLQVWGIRRTPAPTAAMIMTLESVFGALVSILFYHEVVTARIALGFLLIFTAVLLSELGTLRRGAPVPTEGEACVSSN